MAPTKSPAALNGMFEKGKQFEATNPEPDNAYIEFVGELAGAPQPLITVEMNTFAPGVLTFTLPLDRAEMAAAVRAVAELEMPFAVEAEFVDDGEDAAGPAVPGRIFTLFQQPVKVVREQIWEELETVQPMDWMRPPQPRDYLRFTPDQIIFGVQHYVVAWRRRASIIFIPVPSRPRGIPPDLSRERERGAAAEAGRRFPRHGPPAPNSLALSLSCAGPRSAFLAHTHFMADFERELFLFAVNGQLLQAGWSATSAAATGNAMARP